MAYEDLLKSVEESAEEKERELRNKAAAVIEDVRSRAKTQAEAIRQGHTDEAKKSVATERNKLLYLTKAENKELLIKAREAVFEQAFREAERRFSDLRSDPKYPLIFKRLLQEAVGTVEGEAFCVHVDKKDEALCREILAAMNMSPEIRPDLQTAGGVVVNLPGERVVIANTVESRLLRARETRRKEIHCILSGE